MYSNPSHLTRSVTAFTTALESTLETFEQVSFDFEISVIQESLEMAAIAIVSVTRIIGKLALMTYQSGITARQFWDSQDLDWEGPIDSLLSRLGLLPHGNYGGYSASLRPSDFPDPSPIDPDEENECDYIAPVFTNLDSIEALDSHFQSELDTIVVPNGGDEFQESEVDLLLEGLVDALLFSQTDFETGSQFSTLYTSADFSHLALARLKGDCRSFLVDLKPYREALERMDGGLIQVGHDFCLTRNHEGAGFWDGDYALKLESGINLGDILTDLAHGYPELELYVGDDEQIHLVGHD